MALALLLLPWAVALAQVLRHHHLDSGAIGIVATLSVGLPALWLAWAGYLEARKTAQVTESPSSGDSLGSAAEKQTEKRHSGVFLDLIAWGNNLIGRLEGQVGLDYYQLMTVPREEQIAYKELEEWESKTRQRVHDVFSGKADSRLEVPDQIMTYAIRNGADEISTRLAYCRSVVQILQEFEEA